MLPELLPVKLFINNDFCDIVSMWKAQFFITVSSRCIVITSGAFKIKVGEISCSHCSFCRQRSGPSHDSWRGVWRVEHLYCELRRSWGVYALWEQLATNAEMLLFGWWNLNGSALQQISENRSGREWLSANGTGTDQEIYRRSHRRQIGKWALNWVDFIRRFNVRPMFSSCQLNSGYWSIKRLYQRRSQFLVASWAASSMIYDGQLFYRVLLFV